PPPGLESPATGRVAMLPLHGTLAGAPSAVGSGWVTLGVVKLTVRAPATSANLGPGFDCLGLAVDIWGTATVETGRSDGSTQHGVTRLIWQGIQAAFDEVGSPPQVSLTWDDGIPIARGLAASAALRAAGLLAGNAPLQ